MRSDIKNNVSWEVYSNNNICAHVMVSAMVVCQQTTSDSNSAIKSVKITALSSVCKYIGRTKSNILQCLKSSSQGRDKLPQFIIIGMTFVVLHRITYVNIRAQKWTQISTCFSTGQVNCALCPYRFVNLDAKPFSFCEWHPATRYRWILNVM